MIKNKKKTERDYLIKQKRNLKRNHEKQREAVKEKKKQQQQHPSATL